jgi:hypothetical protein
MILKINEQALNKVRQATRMNNESFVKLAKSLEQTLELTGAAETSLSLDYQHDDVEVVPGDLIPVITVSLRQATIKFPGVDHGGDEA